MEAMETITTGAQQLETTIPQLHLEAHHQTDTIHMIEDLHHLLPPGLEDLVIHTWTMLGQQIIMWKGQNRMVIFQVQTMPIINWEILQRQMNLEDRHLNIMLID